MRSAVEQVICSEEKSRLNAADKPRPRSQWVLSAAPGTAYGRLPDTEAKCQDSGDPNLGAGLLKLLKKGIQHSLC